MAFDAVARSRVVHLALICRLFWNICSLISTKKIIHFSIALSLRLDLAMLVKDLHLILPDNNSSMQTPLQLKAIDVVHPILSACTLSLLILDVPFYSYTHLSQTLTVESFANICNLSTDCLFFQQYSAAVFLAICHLQIQLFPPFLLSSLSLDLSFATMITHLCITFPKYVRPSALHKGVLRSHGIFMTRQFAPPLSLQLLLLESLDKYCLPVSLDLLNSSQLGSDVVLVKVLDIVTVVEERYILDANNREDMDDMWRRAERFIADRLLLSDILRRNA
ncbi:hypothetical protein GYMLUDRAFT_59413 [Collybiopsis luxurians FD-317 M1]|uniref:Uncharacterized protein n=1 Tax=Collybiopsis luxurians FD-317 M1 TaxID=944289 RepID=A0A0D0BAH0_9AGAR|nr:hypothetical protein GYMLUDRAFT_59413 [Collybiopsis luxurians FD-317 M1]